MALRPALFTILLSLSVVVPCKAQTADSLVHTPPPPQTFSANAVSAWAGGSFATGGLIGNIPNAHLGLVGIRYQRLLAPSSPPPHPRGPSLTYTADLVPVLLLSIPSSALRQLPLAESPTEETTGVLPVHDLTAYGVGMRPAGLRLTFRTADQVQPFVAGSTGLVFFNRSVPNGLGKSTNFMFAVGAGLRVVLNSTLILTTGYRYYHLSNGFRGQINPGVDANLLQLGVTLSP